MHRRLFNCQLSCGLGHVYLLTCAYRNVDLLLMTYHNYVGSQHYISALWCQDKKCVGRISHHPQGFIQDFLFGGENCGGGISIYEKEGCVMRKRTNPYVNKYATAHLPKGRECPTPPITNESSSSIWWAVLGGRGTCAWGGGNFCLEGEIPGFPPPLY